MANCFEDGWLFHLKGEGVDGTKSFRKVYSQWAYTMH